ncbi:MAG: glycosyl transferase [Clostridia bacterium]|nr:glycosyl transferase [Clostridia bacterium]
MKEKLRVFLLKCFVRLDRYKILRILSDKAYLKTYYKLKFNKKLNLKDPKTFNEKLQWLKLYDRKPEYSLMVDKYGVKKYIADKIGEEYVIPTLGVWDKFADIDFDSLPEQFVLKTTHDSGGVVICTDKSMFNIGKAKEKLTRSLKRNYFWRGREWPYKYVKPRIIAEELMRDGRYESLPVYKFFCFKGKAFIVQVIQNDKLSNETIDYFDREWNLLDLRQNYPNSSTPILKPNCFAEMLRIADTLASVKKNFIRVDLYVVNEKIYFSEFTFFSDSGTAIFHPKCWDKKLGDMIEL